MRIMKRFKQILNIYHISLMIGVILYTIYYSYRLFHQMEYGPIVTDNMLTYYSYKGIIMQLLHYLLIAFVIEFIVIFSFRLYMTRSLIRYEKK